jgi:hypothetical protein
MAFTAAFAPAAARAADSPLTVAPYLKLNSTDFEEKSNSDIRNVLGQSAEGGISLFIGSLGVDLFTKQIEFEKIKKNKDGVTTSHFTFADNLKGGGIHLAGSGFSVRAGRAFHDLKSNQKVADQSSAGLPNGLETSYYVGGGVYASFPGSIDLLLDYTYYRLPSNHYQVSEVTIGLRLAILGKIPGGKANDK